MEEGKVDIAFRGLSLREAAAVFAALAGVVPKEVPAEVHQGQSKPAPEKEPVQESAPTKTNGANGHSTAAKPLVNPDTIARVAAANPAKPPKEEKPKKEKPTPDEKKEEPAAAVEEKLFTEADDDLPQPLAGARKLRDVLVWLQDEKGLQDPEALAAECEKLAKHPQAPGCLTRISGGILDRVKRVLESVDNGSAVT